MSFELRELVLRIEGEEGHRVLALKEREATETGAVLAEAVLGCGRTPLDPVSIGMHGSLEERRRALQELINQLPEG